MTNDRRTDLREYLWIGLFLVGAVVFIYLSEKPPFRPWAGGVWMSLAILTWYGIRQNITKKAGWFAILGSCVMGLAFALYGLHFWLSDDKLQKAATWLIMAFVLSNWWRTRRARREASPGLLT